MLKTDIDELAIRYKVELTEKDERKIEKYHETGYPEYRENVKEIIFNLLKRKILMDGIVQKVMYNKEFDKVIEMQRVVNDITYTECFVKGVTKHRKDLSHVFTFAIFDTQSIEICNLFIKDQK